ncbi:hypothetical protein HYY74_05865 [Candidatus Woesearchaeota archaeon]|nr:hypothetical protein [Candidatus Woesearchaeota archaeon]
MSYAPVPEGIVQLADGMNSGLELYLTQLYALQRIPPQLHEPRNSYPPFTAFAADDSHRLGFPASVIATGIQYAGVNSAGYGAGIPAGYSQLP